MIKRLLATQPRLCMASSHAQLIHCLPPAFGSAHPAVIGLLCDVLRQLYSAFGVGSHDMPKEVQVRSPGPPGDWCSLLLRCSTMQPDLIGARIPS